MGIMGALSTAVSGLSAQSYALENISGNIANSQTAGFKRVNTSFVDLVPDSPAGKELSGAVAAYSQLTNTIQGTVATTGISTNMAISGDGYFVVAKNSGSIQTPSFAGTNLYTRRGDFQTTQRGFLVNGAGQYLVGTTYNPATGAVTGSSLSPFQVPNLPLPAAKTTEMTYSGNLPSLPKPSSYDVATAGSELIKPSSFGTNPVTTGTVKGADVSTFLTQSIPGGEITVYNSSGTPVSAQLRWVKTKNYEPEIPPVAPSTTPTPEVPNTWMSFYQTDSSPGTSDTAWKSIGANVTFDQNGQRTSAGTVTMSNFAVDGITVGDVVLNFAANGLTQYGNANGVASTSLDQNGYTSGTLAAVTISNDGIITGAYSNGVTTKIGQVTIAHFTSEDSLKREDGGAFSETTASGTPTYGMDGATLAGGSIEQSNTDISDEFSKMIVTQQAYSANTRVMSTAQQMLQDVINVIR